MTIRFNPSIKSFSLLVIIALCCATFLASMAPSTVAAAPQYVSLDAKIKSCTTTWLLQRTQLQIRDNAPNYGGKYNAPSLNIVTWWCKGEGSNPIDQVTASRIACNGRAIMPYFEPSWNFLWWKFDYKFKGWYCS